MKLLLSPPYRSTTRKRNRFTPNLQSFASNNLKKFLFIQVFPRQLHNFFGSYFCNYINKIAVMREIQTSFNQCMKTSRRGENSINTSEHFTQQVVLYHIKF